MATPSPERRERTDRRTPDRANDLHRRLEEKRAEIERRRAVRRESDRVRHGLADAHERERIERARTDETATPAHDGENKS
jgi:hypothetical protein